MRTAPTLSKVGYSTVGIVVAFLLSLLASATHADEPLHQDRRWSASEVVGHEQCLTCHRQQADVLKEHAHFRGYYRLHHDAKAKQFAARLGIKSIKRSDRCNRCHFTPQARSGRVRAISGVSCESCHGPSQKWLTLHNNYGGPNVTPATESPRHRRRRIAASIDAGMAHPSHLYAIARNCFSCHVIDDEELVNVAGHPARSEDFELVRSSQGNVRHNFLRTNGQSNPASSTERLRVMHVVGLLTDLEYSLRAVANATSSERFGKEHARQADRLRKQLAKQSSAIPKTDPNHQKIEIALAVATQAKLGVNRKEELNALADQLSKQTWTISLEANGIGWRRIDALLPAPSQYHGTPHQD